MIIYNLLNMLKSLPTYTIIIVSALLMQWHGISFWTATTGWEYGGVWSIAIEAAMLYLWYHQESIIEQSSKIKIRIFSITKWTAAVILIAGPWYQLAGPAVEKIYQQRILTIHIITIETEVVELTKSLRNFETNSKIKFGWAGRIDRTQKRITDARIRLREAQLKRNTLGATWRPLAVSIMQAFALLIVMITQLFAVSSIQTRNISNITEPEIEKNKPKYKTITSHKSEQTKTEKDALIENIAPILREQLKAFGNNQKKFAGHYKTFRPADVSMILNHDALMLTNNETISRPALSRIMVALGIEL